jgi:tetratricopeptide (TPR) repeat protein
LNFYKARCYYELPDFEMAKSFLTEALNFELEAKWLVWTHYLLGRVYYHLSDFSSAKREFELCLKMADPDFVSTHKVFEWLESTGLAIRPSQNNKSRSN